MDGEICIKSVIYTLFVFITSFCWIFTKLILHCKAMFGVPIWGNRKCDIPSKISLGKELYWFLIVSLEEGLHCWYVLIQAYSRARLFGQPSLHSTDTVHGEKTSDEYRSCRAARQQSLHHTREGRYLSMHNLQSMLRLKQQKTPRTLYTDSTDT